MNYKIKKGESYLCTKEYVMTDGDIAFTKGKVYLSEMDGCLKNNDGDEHRMEGEPDFLKYFELHIDLIPFDLEEYKKNPERLRYINVLRI